MNQWKVYAILTAVMIVWGFNLAAVKYLVGHVEPVTLTSFRILLASATVFVILFLFRIYRKPSGRDWLYIVLGSILNVVFHHYFLSNGLTKTSGTNASLILGTGPMLTAVLVSLIMRNYPSKLQWLGVVVGMAGVFATVLGGGKGASSFTIGDIFVFISIFAQVLSYIVIANASKNLDPRVMTAYMMLIGSVILFTISLIQEPGGMQAFADVPPVFWYAFFFSGIFGTAIGHMLYNYSIGQAGPTKAAVFMNLNTLFSLLAMSLVLGEQITSGHLVGLVLIVIGVLFGSGAAEDLLGRRRSSLQNEKPAAEDGGQKGK